MADSKGGRTLYPAIVPPGSAHVHTVHALGAADPAPLALAAATTSGLLSDFLVRSSAGSAINLALVRSLPRVRADHPVAPLLIERALRLNCLTSAWAPLWNELSDEPWTPDSPARIALERRNLLIDIDVLTAIGLGISIDDLVTVYRIGFPVLRLRYDAVEAYDAHGRLVPTDIVKADAKNPGGLSEAERTWTHPESGATYTAAYPFTTPDREADMRERYAHFTATLA